MAKKNYYETLGISKSANADEIKSAYRKLAKQYHPDVNKDPQAQNKFKEINEAYEVLGDEKKRANYDQFGQAEGAPNFNDFFGGGGNFSEGFSGGFSDIFSDIFSTFGGSAGGRKTRIMEKGEDINLQLTISFEEAAFGCKKQILINRNEKCSGCEGTGAKNGSEFSTCNECHGSGRVRVTQNTFFGTTIRESICKTCNGTGKIIKEKCSQCGGKGYSNVKAIVTVNIPAGIDNDQVLKMQGQGNAPAREGISGDLNIKINVLPHKVLIRNGIDILLDLHLPYTTLMLGGKITIPTVGGLHELTIPELTQSGTVMRLKNKGIKMLNREIFGDMLITIKSEFPKALDKKTKEIIRNLQKDTAENLYPKYKKFNENKN